MASGIAANNFTLDTALPWVLNNTPAKCEVNWMKGCQDNQRTDRQTDSFHLLLDILADKLPCHQIKNLLINGFFVVV